VATTAFITCLAFLGYTASASSEEPRYRVPFNLAFGKTTFEARCAECHGGWADGTDKGPPLVHIYYESGHHGDQAFRQAIKGGVRQHHWRFGDMPPRPEVDDRQADAVIKYVRWLQQQNGIR